MASNLPPGCANPDGLDITYEVLAEDLGAALDKLSVKFEGRGMTLKEQCEVVRQWADDIAA